MKPRVDSSALHFPADFVFGAATAAYQIEGAANADGRGESIWDRFCAAPGKVKSGDSGEVACDHYHRYRDDVKLMQDLGLGAYRFSVSWPRVMPKGRGEVNQLGLDFYKLLCDALLEAGIEPWLTLYHWDLPQPLQERGGFENRDIAGYFADYAEVVARALGDRVRTFMTLNEPQVFTLLGHLTGEHAPGLSSLDSHLSAVHHANLAHGRAVQALRAYDSSLRIGPVHQTPPMHPLRDDEEDLLAAQRFDCFFSRIFLDPMHLGRYPSELSDWLSPAKLPIREGDLAIIHQPVDFIGVNNYTRFFVRAQPGETGLRAMPVQDHFVPGARYTAMHWEIYPKGIYEVLSRIHRDYNAPTLYVTENGGAFDDHLSGNQVNDHVRVDLLREYLGEVLRAREDGVNVRGYFVWSLLDNFEWAHGYSKRFGIIHVDYETQKRTPKKSAHFYREVIQQSRR